MVVQFDEEVVINSNVYVADFAEFTRHGDWWKDPDVKLPPVPSRSSCILFPFRYAKSSAQPTYPPYPGRPDWLITDRGSDIPHPPGFQRLVARRAEHRLGELKWKCLARF